VRKADLRASLAASSRTLVQGATFLLTVHLRNAGGTVARRTRLRLGFPRGFLTQSPTPFEKAHCSFAHTTESCAIGRLRAGASTSLSFVVQAGSSGRLRITAVVGSAVADANRKNNADALGLDVASALTRACVVPDVRHHKMPEARVAIRRSGCTVGRLRFRKAPGSVGTVIRQTPAAGAHRAAAAKVDLVLGRK
jgi:hypothetical protein